MINSFCDSCKPEDGIHKLHHEERFIKLLTDIPKYELRINAMIFLLEYNETYKSIVDPVSIINKCSDILLEDKNLKLFLEIVLNAGNFLNTVCHLNWWIQEFNSFFFLISSCSFFFCKNSYNGKALGFKVSFLPKLIDTKANKPSITLLHIIIDEFQKQTNNNGFGFIEELKQFQKIIR